MLSQTKMKSRIRRKTDPELVETLSKARKNEPWSGIAKTLSGSTKNQSSVNLNQIDKESKVGDTVLIAGKVLSKGTLTKKIRIAALSISTPALQKLKESKSEFVTILSEISKNPKAEGLKLIK